MCIVIWSTRFGMAALLLAAGIVNIGVSLPALATPTYTTYNLFVYNSKLSSYGGLSFGTAKVTLNSGGSQANVTFKSKTNKGYYFTSQGSVDVNVNGPFTLGSITGNHKGSVPNNKQMYTDSGSINISQFGHFNQSIKSYDGFSHRSSQISFGLTSGRNKGWSSSTDVLQPNNKLYSVAAHIGVCNSVSNCTSFPATGFVADGSSSAEVPEPASLAVLGVGLLGLAWLSGRNRRRHRSHT